MTGELDVMSHLITVAPVVAVLVWVVLFFRSELKELKAINENLNKELRQSETEALSVVKDLNNTLEKLIIEIKKDV